jgi:hypothetical protein
MPPADPLALVPASSVALPDPRLQAHQERFAEQDGSGFEPASDSRERLPPTAFYDPVTGCYVVGRGGGGRRSQRSYQPPQDQDMQPEPSPQPPMLPPTHRAGYHLAAGRFEVGRGGGGGGGHGGGGGRGGGGGFGGHGFGGHGWGGWGGGGGWGGWGGWGWPYGWGGWWGWPAYTYPPLWTPPGYPFDPNYGPFTGPYWMQ